MNQKTNILNVEDIKLLVDQFYELVRKDDLLAPIFNSRIGNRWPQHLEKMYRFWQTVLLGDHTYYGSPFAPYAHLPVDKTHFNRWLELFNRTTEDHFTGAKAEEAKWRAGKMAEMFLHKIKYYRTNHSSPLS